MSLGIIAVIMLLILLVLLFSGVPVAFALGIVGLLGLLFLFPGVKSPERALGNLAWISINKFSLTPVPLFILMGELLVVGRINETLFGAISLWLQRIRGGLCHATTISSAIFAAMSGSSLATCATLGTVAAPEMLKRGYSKKLTYGAISAGGTLGILIPPSIIMIIYGSLAGVSIGHCFIAGIIPGIMLTFSFIILVAIWGRISPSSIRMAPSVEQISFRNKLVRSLPMIAPAIIIFFVLGGIYLGITTPTEAGAVGAFCALILCLFQGNLTLGALRKALLSTVRATSFIMLIVAGASVVSFVAQYLGGPEILASKVMKLQVSPYLILLLFYLLYFILGMLIEPTSMMIMTVPTLLPTIVELGFDPVWFAVIITLTCEIGLITPPVGMNLYVLRGVSNAKLGEIAMGAAPFVLALIINLVILTAFPSLALWLPSLIG
jgi:tripartite ATP-independent transporter DctM subunit